jgi:hypothetical protein
MSASYYNNIQISVSTIIIGKCGLQGKADSPCAGSVPEPEQNNHIIIKWSTGDR